MAFTHLSKAEQAERGVGKRKKSPEMVATAVAMYASGKTMQQISDALNINRITVRKWVTPIVPSRCTQRLTHNPNVFDEITEYSAYWVGFLMADGCMHEKRCNGQQVLSLALQDKDKYHVERFLQFIECNATLTAVRSKGKKGQELLSHNCAVTSQPLVDALRKYGLCERKSYHAVASSRIEFNRHFWRGVIDGDGCLMATKKVRSGARGAEPCLSLVGTRPLLRQFRNFVRRLIPTCNPTVRRASRGVAWVTSVCSSHAKALMAILYDNSNVSLDRKKAIADEVAAQPVISVRKRRRQKNIFAPAGQAWCGMCKSHKDKSEFNRCATNANGVKNRCKQCRVIERRITKEKQALA